MKDKAIYYKQRETEIYDLRPYHPYLGRGSETRVTNPKVLIIIHLDNRFADRMSNDSFRYKRA